MLTVITLPGEPGEAPEMIIESDCPITTREQLAKDLAITATLDYAAQVFEWWDYDRHVPALILNADGTVDLWTWTAQEDQLAA